MGDEELFKDWKKPNWDEYFMSLAFLVSLRSSDISTKHGCVVVDSSHRIITVGYNGPPMGCIDELIPTTRPEKYLYMAHAERNAIDLSPEANLEGSVFYITGHPCARCLGSILQKKAAGVIYGPVNSHCISKEDSEASKIMLVGRKNFFIREFNRDANSVLRNFDMAARYFKLEKEKLT
jgi:dCMP deaminase